MQTRKLWQTANLLMVIVLVVGLVPSFFMNAGASHSLLKPEKPKPVAIGAMRAAGTHLVPPAHNVVLDALIQEGLPLNASEETIKKAEAEYLKKFEKQSSTWINPKFVEWVQQRENQLAAQSQALMPQKPAEIIPVSATVFAMAVEFGGTDTFTTEVLVGDECVETEVTTTGPLQGEIVRPMYPADNFTLWYSDTLTADAKFYEKLIFGYEGAGRTRMEMTDPEDGQPGINLSGYTVQDYYDHVAGEGNVTINGSVVGWVTVNHSEGWYGADICRTGGVNGGAGVPVAQLVVDAIDQFNLDNPGLAEDPDFWPSFDGNNDGFLDTFWIIHAGMGQEAGGGAQGDFAIWSHSSDLRYYAQWPNGYKVYEGDPGTEDDDIYVGPYTMQPENSETGVFAEEFGHNFFGLPDLYTSDANNSIGNWAIMSSGAWNGYLGGTVPAGMPLWFRMIAAAEIDGEIVALNWQEPMVTRDYTDLAETITIGQLEKTPDGINKGVRINLPQVVEDIQNLAGEGPGAYSGTGRDQTEVVLSRDLEIPEEATGVLSFNSYFEIEEDWDYGYFKVNGSNLPDMDGVTTNYDPNGNNLGNGLTGEMEGTLRFNLAAFKGQTVTIELLYKTDAAATEAGWWVDDFMLDDELIDDFSGADPDTNTFPGWTNSDPGWYAIPRTAIHNQYYLTEWRSMTKYDGKIATTPYIHNTVDPDFVTRIPYNMPAALVYYRNTKYGSTYAMAGYQEDPPSYGSKYQLLIVDQNWKPLRAQYGPTSYATWSGRLSAYDAGLTLQDSKAFTIPAYYGLPGGPWNYPEKPAITLFNDTLGYYGGFYNGAPCPAGYLCFNERFGSAVIPARDLYSARIGTFNFNPIYGLWGFDWTPSWLGSGNPGDDNTQFGVNIELLSKDGDDGYNSTADLFFSNYSVDFLTSVEGTPLADGYQVTYTTEIVNNSVDQDAFDVEYQLNPAPELTIQNIKIDGPKGINYSQKSSEAKISDPARQDAPDAMILLGFDLIPASEKVTVTVTGWIPIDLENQLFDLYGEVWGYDGQVDRGPWWADLYDVFFEISYLPIVFK